MKYPWIAITIVVIWFMATFTILSREESNPEYILAVSFIASAILGIWGFKDLNKASEKIGLRRAILFFLNI